LPETVAWQDEAGRPHQVYQGAAISELF
jgi:hypothetical protein